MEKKVTDGTARVGCLDEWQRGPRITGSSRCKAVLSTRCPSPNPPSVDGNGWDLLDEILERPARPPTVFSEGARHPHGPQKHP